MARRFNIEPRVAIAELFQLRQHAASAGGKVAKAVEIVKRRAPGLMVDGGDAGGYRGDTGDHRTDVSVQHAQGAANVLIFPNLEAGNIAYKLLAKVGGADLIGPIIMGLEKSNARAAARRRGE